MMTPLMEERIGSFITQDLWSKQARQREPASAHPRRDDFSVTFGFN